MITAAALAVGLAMTIATLFALRMERDGEYYRELKRAHTGRFAEK